MEIPITQDLRKFKTKDIGNLSFKEAGYVALAIAVGFATYKVFNCSIDTAILPMLIIIVLGFFKPYGLTCIQFLRTVVKEQLTPRQYINETDFVYDAEEIQEIYGDDLRLSSEWNEHNQSLGNSVNNTKALSKEQKKKIKQDNSRIIH